MKLRMLLHIVCNIIYAHELINLEDDVFSIIYDRRIVKHVCVNLLNQEKVDLSGDFLANEEIFTISFDRYFPNFFICDFKLGQLKKRFVNSSFVIKCYTKEEKILFEFKAECNLNKIIVYDFYSAGKVKLNLEKYKTRRYDAYIICINEDSFVSIKNSVDYIEIVESFNKFFSVMLELKNMCIDKKEDFWFEEIFTYKVFDPSFLIKTRKIKNGIYNVFYLCLKNFKSLSIPRLSKSEHFNFFELARNQLTELYDSLLDLLKSAKSFTENSKEIDEGLKIYLCKLFDTMVKITNMKIDTIFEDNVSEIFNKLQKDINLCDAFVKNVVESEKTNTQIINDCEIKNIDRFVHSFSSILIEYCEILEIFDLIDSQDHYFVELDDVYSDDFNSLDLRTVIFIAKEMKKYLLNYKYDKTDFLIFSETYYFKYKLASKFEIILNYIFMASDFKKKQKNKTSKCEVDLCEIDSVFYKKISDFKLKWNNTFAFYGRLEPFTFFSFLDHLSKESEKSEKEIVEVVTGLVDTSEENESNLKSNFLDNNLGITSSKVNIEDLSLNKIQNDSINLIQDNTTMPKVDYLKYKPDDFMNNKKRHFVKYKSNDAKKTEEKESDDFKNKVAAGNEKENVCSENKNKEYTNTDLQQGDMKKSGGDFINLNENSEFEKEKYSVNNDEILLVNKQNDKIKHLMNGKKVDLIETIKYKNHENEIQEVNIKEHKNHANSQFIIVILFSLSSMICLIVYFTLIKPK